MMNLGFRLAPMIVSILVVVGFVTVLVLLVIKPVQLEASALDILKIMVGTLSTMTGQVVQYHIGSSAGSKSKDDILAGQITKTT